MSFRNKKTAGHPANLRNSAVLLLSFACFAAKESRRKMSVARLTFLVLLGSGSGMVFVNPNQQDIGSEMATLW